MKAGYGAGHLDHDEPLELRRLRAHEEFADAGSRRALDGLDPVPGWRCLELGGGTGSVGRWLAQRCAPGEVVVTDLDTTLLPTDVANLTPLRHDVLYDDFPAASFDLVHARALLEHLPDRAAALARMVGWTAPGGWVCVDATLRITPPGGSRTAFHRCLEGLSRLASGRMGADIGWATGLPLMLAEAGLVEVGVLCTPGVVGSTGNATGLVRVSLEQFGPLLREHDLVSDDDISGCLALLDDPGHADLPFLLISAWGRRPRP
jgi:SAM-dependent methyltransferase